MEANKELSPIVTELFLSGRKLHISFIFVSQFCFKVPKTIRLSTTHDFIMKIPNKRESQQISVSNHSSATGFKDFIKLYKDYTYTYALQRLCFTKLNFSELYDFAIR